MKAYPNKFQFTLLGKKGLHTLQIGDITIKSISSITPLGITIDSTLNFKEQINIITEKHIIIYLDLEHYKSF